MLVNIKKCFCLVLLLALVFSSLACSEAPSKVTLRYEPSPHFSLRPKGTVIDTVVLHATERESLEQVIKIFQSPQFQVSSHYTIGKKGELVRHVKDDLMAWHAGKSKMPDGRESVNAFSIGIELLNRNDGKDPYPKLQIDRLKSLLMRLKKEYPIRYLVSHARVAMPPGRKSDPANLDLSEVGAELGIKVVD